jgi:hypothetical protein
MAHRYLIAGLALALVLAASACGGNAFGHQFAGNHIDSFTVVPAVLSPDGVAQISVVADEDWPGDVVHIEMYVPPAISATAGGLYLTQAEAEAGQRDYVNQLYANQDLLHLDAAQAFYRAPATAQLVTLTATYGESSRVSVHVQ